MQLLESDDLHVSPAVALELEYLYGIGRITERGRTILSWLGRAIRLKEDDASFAAVVEASVDASWTRNPFDRLIVAQASIHNAPLLSMDRAIREDYRHARW